MLTGLGMILGPLLGSGLYTLGGYTLPFYVVSGLLALAAILNSIFLPSDNETADYEQFDIDEGDDGYLVKLFTNGLFLIATLLILPAWSCMDFGIPFIAPFLAETDITSDKNIVGLLFVAMAVSYSLSSLLWGHLCTRFRCQRTLMVMGNLMAALAYLIMGPSPWLEAAGIIIGSGFGID